MNSTAIFLRLLLTATLIVATHSHQASAADPPADSKPARQDIFISGVYPHLTTYGIYSQNGAHLKGGHNECGIGAIVPWADKLWLVNYAPHMPHGSEHKLFSIDRDLNMTIHPESVGGTPAGRMIHRESNQLLIAHYLIDAKGKVRVISPKVMPMRVTAIARHLTDSANMVYYIDMEGAIWEANVHTLAVKRLFKKPVPGWHAKGGYTGQGRLIVSNNGELAVGNYKDVLVGGAAKSPDDAGVLAEWDGKDWRIVERRQFTDITGPAGIAGGGDANDPVWAIGWDRRSLRLKLLEDGKWHTYLLPKASLCNDARHGWYTEWPRIREITGGRWMMDMHGMFFDFPKTYSSKNSAGLKPIGSHLRYIPDFGAWNDCLVLATDETSIQGNPLAGQPQTGLWFGKYEDLKTWGPANGYGGPWIDDKVDANTPSDPFLVAGFDRRVLHLAVGRKQSELRKGKALRATYQQEITEMPDALKSLPRVTLKRGDWHKAAPGYSFTVNHPVTVYLAVDRRGNPKIDKAWTLTEMSLTWGSANYVDVVYKRDFDAGTIHIPGNNAEHTKGSFGMPHTAFIASDKGELKVKARGDATVSSPPQSLTHQLPPKGKVTFTLEVDVKGDGTWTKLTTIDVPAQGYVAHAFADDFNATWLRLKANKDCVTTAFLHQTSTPVHTKSTTTKGSLFADLADADAAGKDVHAAWLYPAKRNRNLRVIANNENYFEFTKGQFEFNLDRPDPKLAALLKTKPEFAVDDASVILKRRGKTLRLPKGPDAFSKPFASGWPRMSRELESERHLANIHGTFYEVPLLSNGDPPAYHLMRPVASHNKQITDFCTWNGLLVLAGVRADRTQSARRNSHVFVNAKNNVALWFGGIDDLWQLGKPVGRGGPWKQTQVKAGTASDPYLMTGYDKKTLSLTADQATTITIEVNVDHQSGWHRYKTISLKPGESQSYEFPNSFSAHWIRFVSSKACIASAQLVYE